MNKTFIFLSIFLLAACNNKNENNSQHFSKPSGSEKHLSEDEINKEAERIADSAANAIDYQAEIEINGEDPKMIEARKILDESTSYVKKGILKEMSNNEVNNKINPLMKKYEALKKDLNPKEVEQLENYRMKEINKVLDLQMQNN
ncbi:hypothetical protein [Elizabethkingia anophelis]|uniref:hypothetical protein n=1 Tax=Elizabethkingia anophelis TaxID=1117645 RepID=UPI000466F38C|nr:hypothetical protein [Elizabethkingia anophelis]